MLKESSVDFPREELDLAIWQKDGEEYTLRQDVHDKIMDVLNKYPETIEARTIHITGSIGTNQYSDVADVDVHIIPAKIHEWTEDDVKTVMKWFNNNRDAIDGWIEEHPIEVYIQTNPPQELLSAAVYDMTAGTWIKGPQMVDTSYNPYEDFSDIVTDLRTSLASTDAHMGELNRDLIDYETMKDALNHLPKADQQEILIHAEEKLEEIEDDINVLYGHRKEWSDARKASSSPTSSEQAMDDIELGTRWKNENARFKLINRYKYTKIIGDLHDLLEDGKITDDEIAIIKDIM